MKKILPVLVLLLILGVGGYFYMSSKGMTPKIPVGTANTGSGNVFTSIKDALSKSMSLKCVYKDEKGIETTTYIKGGAVRVMLAKTTEQNQPDNIVMKDKKMYMWTDTTKTGFTFTLNEPKNISPVPSIKMEKGLEKKTDENQQESILAGIEKFKDSCKVEVIADSFFAIPTDVKFQDMEEFTKQMMKAAPPVNPAGNGATSEESQKALEELMKQITPGAGSGQ
jgi:hypothetical protein